MGGECHFVWMLRKCGVDTDRASNGAIVCVSDQLEAHLGEWKNKRVPVLSKRLRGRHRQARVRQLANGCVMIHILKHHFFLIRPINRLNPLARVKDFQAIVS